MDYGANWYVIGSILSVVMGALFIIVIFYSAKTWRDSNRELSFTIKEMGDKWAESSERLAKTVEMVGQSLEHVVSELGKDTEKVADRLVAGNNDLIKEIQNNRDAIKNLRDMFWWLPK